MTSEEKGPGLEPQSIADPASTESTTERTPNGAADNGALDKDIDADGSSSEVPEHNVREKQQEAQRPAAAGPPQDEEPKRGKGRIALIMFALGVCSVNCVDGSCH